MKVERYIPTTSLRPFIKDYLFIESEQETDNVILPGTSVVLVIRYRGNTSIKENENILHLPDTVISGIRKSSRLIHYGCKTGNLLVNFTPGGAAAFFSEPLNELTERSIPTDFLHNYSDLPYLPEQLAASTNKQEMIVHLEKMLKRKLIRPQIDPLVLSAIKRIHSANGIIRISELTRELYISQDAFEKRFRQTVGASPKHFSSIIRLRNAIDTYSAEKTLTDTALTAGYYDQAHFIKDFNRFTGRSPHQFFRDGLYW